MKLRSTPARVALVAAAGLWASAAANATLELTTATGVFIGVPPSTSSGPTAAEVAAALGIVPSSNIGSQLYKMNTEGANPEEGVAAPFYTTTFDPLPAADGGTIEIKWDGPQWISPATALVIKDGAHGHWAWDLSGWDGKTTIIVHDPYTTKGDVSNVQLYGVTTVVPEPSTYIAGGLALLPLLFGLRSRFSKKA